MVKRWQCTVCGYIHEGHEPPEFCPVCGADRSKFIPLDAENSGLFHELVSAFKLHPVLAHFPGGLMPTAALFLIIYFVTKQQGLEDASFWLVLVLTIVVPFSLASGLHDWRKYFGRQPAPVFYKKLALALTLFTLGLVAIALRYDQPGLLATDNWQRWLYLICLLGMLTSVSFLGHYGSLLAVQVAQRQEGPGFSLPSQEKELPNRWFEDIVNQAPDAILAADTAGVIRLWNLGAEHIFGIPTKQAIGQSLNLIIPEHLRERHWAGWAQVMQTGKSRYGEDEMLRVPAIRKDGSRFSAEFCIVTLKEETGHISGVAAILRDVSEQWDREKRLQSQLDACQKNIT